MIHDWKVPEWEITEFEYKHDRTPAAQKIPTQTSKP